MKHLKVFQTQEEFNDFLWSENYIEPNISYVSTDDNLSVGLPKPPPYLKFTANEANSTIRLDKNGSPSAISLQYSTDNGSTWSNYTWSNKTGQTITLTNIGDKVMFKGINTTISYNENSYYKFVMTGSIAASGDVTSLLNGVGGDVTLSNYCYKSMFNGCTALTTAPELPATTLAEYCYNNMFYGCTSLTTAPALSATTLANNCYNAMFKGCTSLTTAPALPATTLSDSCYSNMFQSCTALTTAPELPATTLAAACYYYMFSSCTALTTAPELPATTLVGYCYQYMFYGCSNLNYIKALFTTTPSNTYTQYWVRGVSSTGVFIKNSAATWTSTGTYAVPNNWVAIHEGEVNIKVPYISTDGGEYDAIVGNDGASWSITSKPEWVTVSKMSGTDYVETITLTAQSSESERTGTIVITNGITTSNVLIEQKAPRYLTFTANAANSTIRFKKEGYAVARSLQYSTNNGSTWSNYTTGQTITLANIGDKVMFKGINGTISNYGGDYHKFEIYGSVAASGDVTSLLNGFGYDATLTTYCFQQMFSGCTALTTAPELPSTILLDNCYEKMFYNCTALTTAPELPATTLAQYCYKQMFSGCTALTTAPELPATTLADYCYSSMFSSCTSLTIAPELPAAKLKFYCYSEMFYGCSSLTTAPELPAITLVDNCYNGMFYGCTNLNYIKALFTKQPNATYTYNWVYGVASDGVFIKNSTATWTGTGANSVPSGWTVETASA